MSGGSLNYFYAQLEDHAGDFSDMELDDLVKDLANLFYEREWFLSGDKCEGEWVEALDEFKKKWFSACGRMKRIEKYLDDMKEDVIRSLGLSDRYCKNCERWKQEEEKYSAYGTCELNKGGLKHRSESCEEFKRKKKEGCGNG